MFSGDADNSQSLWQFENQLFNMSKVSISNNDEINPHSLRNANDFVFRFEYSLSITAIIDLKSQFEMKSNFSDFHMDCIMSTIYANLEKIQSDS